MALLETPGNSQASLGQSLVGVTAPFPWVLVNTGFFYAKSLFPSPVYVLAALWWG